MVVGRGSAVRAYNGDALWLSHCGHEMASRIPEISLISPQKKRKAVPCQFHISEEPTKCSESSSDFWGGHVGQAWLIGHLWTQVRQGI